MKPDMIVNAPDYAQSTEQNTAFVQIGDRTFGKKGKYAYTYDLAEIWKDFTGLPFVFAAWIANKNIPKEFMDEFNQSLKVGLDNRAKLINGLPARSDFDLTDYLMHKLDFNLSENKIEALHLFIDYIKKLD
jgi:chorismate dehydratase